MFGSSTAGAAGGFGSTGGAFGSAPAVGAGGFGSTTGGFGAAPAAGGFGSGGFGSKPAIGTAGGFGSTTGGFGSPAAATGGFGTTGGFGSTAPSAGGFGAPAAGGFGSTGTAGAAGGFGSTAGATGGFGAARPATGGFGSTPAAGGFGSAPAAGGFGSTPTTGGFGAAPATGGFGSAAPASSGGFGGFGSAPAPATSSFGGSAGGFGSLTAAKPAGSFGGGFGATGTSSFGAPGSSNLMQGGFGQQQQMQQMQQQQQQQGATGKIARSIEKLQQAYAPYQDQNGKVSVNAAAGRFNDECYFKTIMYDKRTGPAHAVDPSLSGSLLEEAEMNNPDPARYYPVRIIGVDALKARFDHQQAETLKLKDHARSLKEVIEAVELSNTQLESRFSGLQMKQIHVYQKLMSLLRKVEVLRCRGLPMENTEQRYRARLNEILAAMKNPYLEIQELANNVAQQEFPQDVYSEAPSEADLESLYDALRRQREGLEYITDILTKDIRDVTIARSGLQEANGF